MRRHGRFLSILIAAALAGCEDGGGGEPLGLLELVSDEEGNREAMPSALTFCCEGAPREIATIFVAARLSEPHPSRFDPDPQPGWSYLGVSIRDITPPGALTFRWNGAFVADVHRDENAARAQLPFDPDPDHGDVGEIWTGRAGELEVSAQHCDFLVARFNIVVWEYTVVPEPLGGVVPSREHVMRVEIRNDCDPLPPPPPPTLRDEIVFSNTPPVGAAERDSEIWKLHQSTQARVQLTDNRQIEDMDPAWSPDRSEIVFVSNRVDGARIDFDLVVMDGDGNGPKEVTDLGPLNQSADDPAWSPVVGERRIAFARGPTGSADNDIWILDLEEAEASPDRFRQLTTGGNADSSPAWSPDGSKIAFLRAGKIHVVTAAGGTPTQLYPPVGSNDFVGPIDWSPEGIVFDLYDVFTSRTRLSWIDDSGGSLEAVTFGGTHRADYAPSWSTTSDSAVFVRQAGETGHRLFTVDIDAGGPYLAEEIAGQPDGDNRDPDCGFPRRP